MSMLSVPERACPVTGSHASVCLNFLWGMGLSVLQVSCVILSAKLMVIWNLQLQNRLGLLLISVLASAGVCLVAVFNRYNFA